MAIGLTLANLRSLLREYIDDLGSDRFTNARLDVFLNEAQKEIQKIIDDADEHYFSKCQAYSVVSSTDSYEFTLPDDLKKVIIVEREVSGAKPIPARWLDFRRRHSIPDTEDFWESGDTTTVATRPVVYLRGTKLGVVAPGDSYTLRMWYTYLIPDLVADGDFSEIPSEYRNLIPLYASKLTKGEGGQLPTDLKDEYNNGVARLTAFIEARQRQQPRSVNYDPYDHW